MEVSWLMTVRSITAATKRSSGLILFLSVYFVLSSCQGGASKEGSNTALTQYEIVQDWPQLPEGFELSDVTAVGIDSDQNVVLFQRTGRHWTEPFPDSLISSNTIFLLDHQTGKVLDSWGANLFVMPHGLTVDHENNIWVTDVALQQIFKFSHEGILLMKLGVAKIAGKDSMHFNLPTDVAIAKDGSFYVSDGYGNSRILKFQKEGKYLFEWGIKGDRAGEFDTPHGIDLDSTGNIYVADRENNRIQKFSANGQFLKEWKNNSATQLYSLAIDKGNDLFAIDNLTINDTVIKGADIIHFDSSVRMLVRFGRTDSGGVSVPRYHDIDIDSNGNIYVAETLGKRVRKFRRTI